MKKKIEDALGHIRLLRVNKLKRDLRTIINPFVYRDKDTIENDYILTQIVYDYNFILKIFVFCTSLVKIKKSKIIAYDTHISWGFLNEKFNYFINLFSKNGFHFLYEDFSDNLFVEIDIVNGRQPEWIKLTYNSVISQLNSPKDILDIKFDNILVGDLIYDTYLRYYKMPTIYNIDKNVCNVIFKAIVVYFNFNNLFNTKNIIYFVTTYTTYIQHGIPTRIALSKGVTVYSISSNTYIFQEVTTDFPYHTKNFTSFSSDLSIEAYNEVKFIFESRFSGSIDKAISYMRKSSFSNNDNTYKLIDKFKCKRRNVVIYIHDFYDSPHINRCLMFDDLYHFVFSVFENIFVDSDSSFFVKAHPNSVYNTDKILTDLVEKYSYKSIYLLDSSISNNDIIKMRPDLIVTARGTVTIEMAYFNIPVVALFDNPYVNFDFVHTCYTLKEFYDIVNGFKSPALRINRSDILSFYYQYFLRDTIRDKNNLFSIDFDASLLNNELGLSRALNENYNLIHLIENTQKYLNEYVKLNYV